MDTPGNIFHVNSLVFVHWFISNIISLMKENSISLYQDIYATSILAKYLDTVTVKTSFFKTTFTSNMIFTKGDVYNSDDKVLFFLFDWTLCYNSTRI